MAPGSDECQVRDVKLRQGQLGPVLVTFEHAKLRKREATELKCGVFTSTKRGNVSTVAAVAEDGDVVYQGDVRKDAGDICRTFLAVRNKRTNKVRIYEASSAMLSPTVASNFVDEFDPQDKKQAFYKLQHAFGSKKSKRVVDQRARMEVNVDAVKEKLSTTVNDVTIKEDMIATVEDDTFAKMLPLCNREASTPAEIYPISGLLKKKELQSLEKYLSEAEESDPNLDRSKLSPFYNHMVSRTSGRPQAAALLLYAESLIRFCKSKKVMPNTKICLYSDLVTKRIVKDFLSVTGFVSKPSQFVLDKAIMHIIIIGLHIGSFSVDLEPITQSLPYLDIGRVKMLARMLGTRPPAKTTGAPNQIVSLSAPLPSLESLMPRRAKGKGRR